MKAILGSKHPINIYLVLFQNILKVWHVPITRGKKMKPRKLKFSYCSRLEMLLINVKDEGRGMI